MLQFTIVVGDMMILIYILLITIPFLGMIGIFYLTSSSVLKKPLFRIKEAEKIINEVLEKKLDLIIRANGILQNNTDLNVDMFGEIEQLKRNKVSNIKLDRKLSSAFKTIAQIKSDYSTLEENRGMNEVLKEIKVCDEKLEATKKFYNQYSKKLEELKNNCFRKLVSKIMKIKDYQLYNTKKTNDEIVNIDNL